MSDHALDENTLVIPSAWKRQVHPRRGGMPGPKIKLDAESEQIAAACLEENREKIEHFLAAPGTDPSLIAPARAYLSGEPDALGAAVTAVLAAEQRAWSGAVPFADAWTFTHGVGWAACAVVEMAVLHPHYSHRRDLLALKLIADDVQQIPYGQWEGTLKRMRTLLAVAGDAEYAEAVERLAGHRRTDQRRLVTGYLVPTRKDWVAECCHAVRAESRPVLLDALGSAEHLEILGPWARLTQYDCYHPSTIMTLAEGVGAACAPLLIQANDDLYPDARRRKVLLGALGILPSDEAFRMMLERRSDKYILATLLESMKRFPVRAIRELAAVGEPDTDELLATHVKAHLELAESVLPELPEEARAAVERIVGGLEILPAAELSDLPRVLADPPWKRVKEKAEPVVIKGLTAPDTRVAWDEGEREEWEAGARVPLPYSWYVKDGPGGHVTWGKTVPAEARSELWETRATAFEEGGLDGLKQLGMLVLGPVELARPLIRGWFPEDWDRTYLGRPETWMPVLIARFELDALATALRFAQSRPAGLGHLVVPFADATVAELASEWLLRTKSARPHAEAWLRKHGSAAVPLLLPTALGKPGKRRNGAEYALHLLAAELGRDAVVEAAGQGPAAQAVAALLERDPDELVPRKIPEVGAWADPATLPQVLLKGQAPNGQALNGQGRALPDTVVPHLLTILAMSAPDDPDPGIEAVREACDPASLSAFAWALFERWREHGERSEGTWALTAVGWFGDDEAARRLTPVIRAWPGQNGHHKAVKGLDVLALIGTEAALMLLDGIAQKAKFKAIKLRAQEKIQEVAERLGLTGEQLGDRLVPGFDLDPDGSMTLDYGPRRFVVGFDEQLKPYVTDEDGKRRAALPKPGAKDDPALAPAAYAAFAQLKKDVRAVASIQIRRLELAMTTERRWTVTEFRELLAGHPLMWHIVRRLVWSADGTAFRLAEDRTFADLDDEAFTPPAEAEIALAHPLSLDGTLDAWAQVLADYEITQPFPQLGREVHRLAEEERQAGRLARFEGLNVPWGKVLGLERRGWRRGTPEDNGTERWISRPVRDGLHVVIALIPGIQVGYGDQNEDQVLETIWLDTTPRDFPRPKTPTPFGELDEVTASEVLADLVDLKEAAL
ncbi:DUF4132 domain-containing protein [Actinomadura sp. 9N407]|uniref:DUF4132 domain-containing protein n=1 Tax=Actinomadura sp. 9N407 TaxID=3375154 RepID=UPI0037A747B9